MTGDELYERTKAQLRASATPWQAYCRARMMMLAFLLEQVPQPTVWRWKREAQP